MPELPEVETIRRTLSKHVLGLEIKDVIIRWPGVVQSYRTEDFKETVVGRIIQSIERRGKYLLITLDEGWSLIAHMRMTGRLYYFREPYEVEKHTHIILKLSKGEIHFNDTRKFGRIQLVRTDERLREASLKKLGPEPLSEEFTAEILEERLKSRRVAIKVALLDQTVLAGLGNIYVDEALFKAGILPERQVFSLSKEEIAKLYESICAVLIAGIDAQGTSFRDYRDANGEKGSFQEALNVYGRGGLLCKRCGNKLTRIRLGGRSTVFCTQCQI